MRKHFFCFLFCCTLLAANISGALAQDPITSRSVVTAGDTARLQQALAKGRRGEPVTVAVIGGSITAGAGASSREKCPRMARESGPALRTRDVQLARCPVA